MEKISIFESQKTTAEIFEKSDPKIIEKFTPSNAEQAKLEFLENPKIEKPNNFYENLNQNSIDELYGDLSAAVEKISKDDNLGAIERNLYERQLEVRIKRVDMLQAAVDFHEAKTSEEKFEAEYAFMKNNIEVFGEPEKVTFESLIGEKMAKLKTREFNQLGKNIFEELSQILDKDYSDASAQRFKPSKETVEGFGEWVHLFYQKQLDFVKDKPDGKFYTAEEIARTFQEIVDDFEQNYGFSHFDVVFKKSGAIQVSNAEKKIKIPENRAPVSKEKLEGLIVHEIGTHYYRSQIGEKYGISPLQLGLDGYLDTEEGIARAMEMSVAGKFEEAGVPHYLTAGLAYFEGKNFREVFETNWRLYVLEKSKNGEITDEEISKQKDLAYKNTQRIFRGTDELSWFKDLSYFNGGQKVWRYIEENIDSPTLFDDLLLGGKNDILNQDHQRSIYELKNGKR